MEHIYLSTACLHGEHGYCVAPTVTRNGRWSTIGPSYSANPGDPKRPATCKFCNADCICFCHHDGRVAAEHPTPIP